MDRVGPHTMDQAQPSPTHLFSQKLEASSLHLSRLSSARVIRAFCVCRAFENLNLMTSLETYNPQMSPSLKNEVEQHSSNQEKEIIAQCL